MTPVIVRYPLDSTGVSANNLVQGERHEMVRRKVRAIAPIYGAFFTDSLKVVDNATNLELTRGTQFVATEMYEIPTQRFGKEVCAIILVLDEAVSDNVTIRYQAVGGEFSTSMVAVTQLLENLALDERPLSYASIIDKPAEYKPSHHLHDAGDLYGFEYAVQALERVRVAVETGDRLSHDAIYRYIDATLGDVSQAAITEIINRVNAGLAEHLAHADPHTQYLLRTEAVKLTIAAVRTPVAISPLNGATNVLPDTTLALGAYHSLYGLAQQSAQFQVSQNADCSGPYAVDVVQGVADSYRPASLLTSNTQYYWRGRYRDVDSSWSEWSEIQGFQTAVAAVATPAVTSPVADAIVKTNGLTLQSSAFAVVGGIADAISKIEWEVWTGPNATGERIFQSSAVAAATNPADYGEVLFTTPGTYNWICPPNIYSIGVIAIGAGGGGGGGSTVPDASGNSPGGGGGGGGGLAWKNNIPVVPGQSYTVVVGAGGVAGIRGTSGNKGGDSYFNSISTVRGIGGGGGFYAAYNNTNTAGLGGSYIGDGGGNGGNGGYWFGNVLGGSGGGAGGYSGAGGNANTAPTGAVVAATAGTGGGASGGASVGTNSGSGGGGTGVYGLGTSGAAVTNTAGLAGSGGTNGVVGTSAQAGAGGNFGGGGGGADGLQNTGLAANGGNGALRIVLGAGRTFPATNVGASSSTLPPTSVTIARNVLSNFTTYYPRVRHTGVKLGPSAWSNPQAFAVDYPLLPTVIGEFGFGGYYAGDVTYGGKTYAIVVAPKESGETTMELWNSAAAYSGSDFDSVLNNANLLAVNPGAGAAFWAKNLRIAEFDDWVVPALEVMRVIGQNLRSSSPSAPAVFKSGGSQIFQVTAYWTSSPYTHVVDESYYDPDTPIYDYETVTTERNLSFNNGPTGESVDYSHLITCNSNEDGPYDVSGPNFEPSGNVTVNGENIGYHSASWTCSRSYIREVIVGYEPGEYHYQMTTYNHAHVYYPYVPSATYTDKNTRLPVRAVRLLLK